MPSQVNANHIPFRGFFVYLWIIAIILAGSFMTFRLIKNPIEEPQGSGLALNNLKHNPALVNNLQILLVITIFIVTAYPAMFVAGQGPNSFILGTLPGCSSCLFGYSNYFLCFQQKAQKICLEGNQRSFWIECSSRWTRTTPKYQILKM